MPDTSIPATAAYTGSMGFFGWLTLAFIVLKLTHVITWSWLWVLAPVWIPLALALLILIVMVAFWLGAGLLRWGRR